MHGPFFQKILWLNVSNYSGHYPVSKHWFRSLFYAFLCPCSNWQGLAMIPCRAGWERYIDLVMGLLSLTFISRKPQDMNDKFLWIDLHLESFGRKVRSNSVARAVGLGTIVVWSSFGSLFTVKDSQTRWCTLDQSKGSNRFLTAIFLKARTDTMWFLLKRKFSLLKNLRTVPRAN